MPDSTTINLAELGHLASSALDRGLEYILSCTLPSAWHPRGRGWQEQWKAPFAGFYASCDGVLLLDTCPTVKHRDGIETILENVYSNHLCLVVDAEEHPADDSDKQRMRDTCLGTTTKLAKFLQASTNRNPLQLRHHRIISTIREKIVTAGRQNDGGWPANIDNRQSPIISATCESLIALSTSYTPDISDLIQKGAAFLLETLNKTTNKKWKLAILWALAEIAHNLDTDNLGHLKLQSRNIAPLLADLDEDCINDTFSNSLGHGDYYHFNARILGSKSILRLYSLDILDSNYLCLCAPTVQNVAKHILSQGRFFTHDASNMGPRFWEHYQAMLLLSDYSAFIEDHQSLAKRNYMWISPRQFEEMNFTVKPDLAFVLMPFRPNWSADVYTAISEAVASKGFFCWRSDLRFKDDKIVQSVWEDINRARFIIAECTGQNPNVFYELGIAHTIGKPVFICAQNRKDIPFDLSAIRSFMYGGATPTQLKSLQTDLSKFIDELDQ